MMELDGKRADSRKRKWVIIQGSPRVNGTCARVVRSLALFLEADQPEIDLEIIEVPRSDISGCNGCEYCRTNDRCIIEDDMVTIINALEGADRAIMVAPVYFAGLPSQTKALIDRLQPYYWRYVQRKALINGSASDADDTKPDARSGEPLLATRQKRPLTLYVIGDGGDPHGYEPLVVSVKSAFALAGFAIDQCIELIGIKRITVNDLGLDHLRSALESN